jgi:hypothetical protein
MHVWYRLVFAAIVSSLLTACGGGSDTPTPPQNQWDQINWDQGQWA